MNNKILLTVLTLFTILFLSINSISALEIDNRLTYSNEDLKVTFENLWGLPLIGSELGTAELKSHSSVNYIKEVGAGNQIVMWYDFNFTELYINGLGEVTFTDIKTGKIIDREYSFVYWGESVKDVWSKRCDLVNGTKYCESYISGTETYPNWVTYNNKNIPKGNIRIGLRTYVKVNDYVDGVWEIVGKKIKKHSEWGANLNVGIVSHYNLDEVSGPVIDSLGTNNGTNSGCTAQADGIINKAYTCDADAEEITFGTITDFGGSGTGNFTLQIWVKTKTLDGGDSNVFIYNKHSSSAGGQRLFVREDGGVVNFFTDDGGAASMGSINLESDRWYHIVLTRSGSNGAIFVNNTKETGTTKAGDIGTNNDWEIGHLAGALTSNSDLDEFVVWDRVLTDAEVEQLFNNFLAITYTIFFLPTVTLNSPIDTFNSTSQTINFNGTITSPNGITNVTLFIDGVLNETNSSGINDTDYLFTKTLIDGNHNYTYESCNVAGCTTETVRTFTIDTTPTINVLSPGNISFNDNDIDFEASSDLNVDFWIINYNGTNVSIEQPGTSLLEPIIVEDGSFQLLLYANNSVSGIFGLNDTIFFSVDTTPPDLNITLPLNTTYIDNFTKTTAKTINLNYTVVDPNLDSCWALNISSGSNITLASCVNVTFFSNYSQHTFIIYANDTLGNNASDTEIATFDYKILQNSFSFANTTMEGSLELFSYDFNVSAGVTASSVALIYNGTSYSTTLTTSGDNVVSSRNLIIPGVSAETNISLNWNITLSDGFTYNSSSYNQTIQTLGLDDCSVFTNLIYNYSLVDEELQTNLSNSTVELNIDFYDFTETTEVLNYSKSYTANPILVCIDGNILATANYSVDSIVKYEAASYEIEYYNIENFILSNTTVPQNITLYDLNSSDSTEFQLTFTGSDYLPVENALVLIKRQYIAENNTFKTVELPKTDSNGQTIVHLVKNDIVYSIQIIKDGVILGTFNNLIAFCEDFTIGDCKISLNAFDSVEEVFLYDEALGLIFTAPVYNESANTITFDFATYDGSVKTVDLNVTRNDIFGNRTICVQSVSSASGSLQCTLSSNLDDTKLRVTILVDGQEVVIQQILLDSGNFGAAGYLIFFLMAMSMVLMFSGSKPGVLFAIILSFVGAVGLGILSSEVIGLGAAGLWIIIAALLGLWKLNQEKPQ